MTISPDDAVGHVDYKGQTYYFCSQSCLDQFRSTPDAFLGERPAARTTHADMEREYTCPMDPEVRQKGPGACPKCGMALEPVDVAPLTKTEWTCPTHPEIVRDAPGSCPICGMALEPRVVTIEESSPELDDMTRRFWWSAAITVPMLAFMISEFLPGRPLQTMVPHGWMNWIQLALATPVVLWGGWPFFVRGWASVVNRDLNMFTLIALGVGAAFVYSVIATLAPGVFPDSFRIMGEVAVYFEPAAVIVVLVLLGQVLELRARSRTSSAIRNLLGLAPKTARRIEADGTERDVPLSEVHVGERLRVRPGERVPVDGAVLEGRTTIDESMVTGEPIPVEKGPDAQVTGGTVNGTGTFVMKAERVGADTLLAQIVRMVSEAQRSRAPIQRLADTVSGYFVPAVMPGAISYVSSAVSNRRFRGHQLWRSGGDRRAGRTVDHAARAAAVTSSAWRAGCGSRRYLRRLGRREAPLGRRALGRGTVARSSPQPRRHELVRWLRRRRAYRARGNPSEAVTDPACAGGCGAGVSDRTRDRQNPVLSRGRRLR
jgi:Cu+-exporting ATPase